MTSINPEAVFAKIKSFRSARDEQDVLISKSEVSTIYFNKHMKMENVVFAIRYTRVELSLLCFVSSPIEKVLKESSNHRLSLLRHHLHNLGSILLNKVT